jgi:hypothetical protein
MDVPPVLTVCNTERFTNSHPRNNAMKRLSALLFSLALGVFNINTSFAQMDPMVAIEQLQQQANRNVNQSQRQAVEMYRRQSGDYRTPDNQVVQYLLKRAHQQNPQWSANYQQRQSNFQKQQSQYSADRNSQMDQNFNNYMNNSRRQQQGHDQFVREGVWDRGFYGDRQGNVYELPNFQPNQMYETKDGQHLMQDSNGRYRQFDRNGW